MNCPNCGKIEYVRCGKCDDVISLDAPRQEGRSNKLYAIPNYQIPFDDEGMQTYPTQYRKGFCWKDNFTFEDTLTLDSMSRGRSAAGFVWLDSKGKSYYMFMKHMSEVLLNNVIDHGKVTGTWTFCKIGQNYGLRQVKESETADV